MAPSPRSAVAPRRPGPRVSDPVDARVPCSPASGVVPSSTVITVGVPSGVCGGAPVAPGEDIGGVADGAGDVVDVGVAVGACVEGATDCVGTGSPVAGSVGPTVDVAVGAGVGAPVSVGDGLAVGEGAALSVGEGVAVGDGGAVTVGEGDHVGMGALWAWTIIGGSPAMMGLSGVNVVALPNSSVSSAPTTWYSPSCRFRTSSSHGVTVNQVPEVPRTTSPNRSAGDESRIL